MVPHHGTMHPATRTELRRTQRALTSVARALLLVRLLGRAGNLTHTLGRMRAGASLGQLPMHHPRHDIGPGRLTENRIR